MHIERFSGGYRITEEIRGFLHCKDYYYYTKKDAIALFKQYKKTV